MRQKTDHFCALKSEMVCLRTKVRKKRTSYKHCVRKIPAIPCYLATLCALSVMNLSVGATSRAALEGSRVSKFKGVSFTTLNWCKNSLCRNNRYHDHILYTNLTNFTTKTIYLVLSLIYLAFKNVLVFGCP